MKKTIISTAAAAIAATALTSSAAPVGYDNAGGYWLFGTLNLSPFAEISYNHDDNPHGARDYAIQAAKEDPEQKNKIEESDSVDYKIGLNLLLPGNHWKLTGRAYYLGEEYTSDSIDDRHDWSEQATLSGSTDGGSTWALSELVQKVQYDDKFEITQQDRLQVALDAKGEAVLTEKSSLLLGAFYTDNDYDDEQCYDYSSYGGNLGFAHQLTDKTDWTLGAIYTVYDKDEYDSDAYGINGQIGLRSRATEKLTFDVSIGAEYFKDFEYKVFDADGNLVDKGEAEDEVGFTYRLAANWKITDRLSLVLSGYSDYEPAEDVNDNSLYANAVSATLTYQPGDNWRFRAGAAYRREDYNRDIVEQMDPRGNPYSSVENGDNRTDDEISTFAEASYAFTRYCSIFVDWRYTDVSSSISGYDYDRQRYGAGIALKY